MILKRIVLRSFRNYQDLDISFENGVTIINGPNGVGKTNLVEAIYYLSLGRSWRNVEDETLVNEKDEEGIASIEAFLQEGEISRRIEISLGESCKRVSLNGKQLPKLSDLSRLTNVLLFSPRDVSLFIDSPTERRRFLDINISKQSSDYLSLIGDYNKLLKERNAALKDPNRNLQLIEVITRQMVEISEPLVRYRSMYVTEINRVLPKLLYDISGEEKPCKLVYRPFVRPDETFLERAAKVYEEALQSDLQRGFTNNGPHREDIGFLLDGKDIADYGSQGENRTAALSLKLAPFFLVESDAKKPIVVLDDVTSELDEGRVQRLFRLLKQMGQVFVTATKLEIEGVSYIDVASNKAVRR